MTIIKMLDKVGTFASNKDFAREIRTNLIIPTLERQEEMIIDFDGVDGATQSFMHALISDAIRKFGIQIFLSKVSFKSCNDKIRAIVTIVTDYMQAGLEELK
ncbi:MAG TPA: STAS-like domain-containing protein [Candidatus Peribacteraceae bacterium]|nr:STAS-like domain-containing protein [Candidatus Peribacteraceae bacterium]